MINIKDFLSIVKSLFKSDIIPNLNAPKSKRKIDCFIAEWLIAELLNFLFLVI